MKATTEELFLSVVVLCYRSGKTVVPFFEKLYRMLSLLHNKWEIILVGNYMRGTDDETPEIVKILEQQYPSTRAITLPKKGMMGWDMRKGLNAASGKYIALLDGDGQFPLESVIACLLKIESESLDLVKTYRVRREDGFYRRGISAFYNGLFKILFNTRFHDVNSKPKVILRSKYRLLNLQSDDWFADAEMMIRAKELNFRMGEIPIHFYANENRKSFVKPRAIFEFVMNLFRYRFFRKYPISCDPPGPA